ncbi:ABC transporter ATP-binding protein [Halopelagius longus]|uniref:ABC transporter ATP-binding protein n=1 Tax=Halopelagius longus TaxID=1236180 RepID=A0A1H1FRF5_9EURY|nr:ABC transporter ATP-binding protein [Halopelagius longus]RDI70197.1 ABC transporter ATP-binding protein [Halopelagius longus]SDR03517.1 peptide/nickel transport system ATP-binding protein/peptide/nickel transport system ATP-binding protein [Halopelagius longus]
MSTVDERADVPSTNQETIMELRDVSVTFPMGRGDSRVLDNVDIDVERGEILGIVGESGSGKSMLASSMLDGVEDPGITTGEVTYYPPDADPISVLDLDDKELNKLRWEDVAMVFQGAMNSFNPTMTIRGHFRETLEAHNADVEEGMRRARNLLSDLYLEPDRVLDSYAHELSGGMSQRALIALSLILQPEMLIMDEPTAALDLLMQRSIVSLLEELADKYDLTMVFITHDLPLVAKLADRLAVLYAFELVELAPTEDVLLSSSHPYTRALLRATPNVNAPLEEMKPIEGVAPNPSSVPKGCSYHPRCPVATEQCTKSDPSLFEVDDDHRAACFYPDEARESVPFELDGETEHTADLTSNRGGQ